MPNGKPTPARNSPSDGGRIEVKSTSYEGAKIPLEQRNCLCAR